MPSRSAPAFLEEGLVRGAAQDSPAPSAVDDGDPSHRDHGRVIPEDVGLGVDTMLAVRAEGGRLLGSRHRTDQHLVGQETSSRGRRTSGLRGWEGKVLERSLARLGHGAVPLRRYGRTFPGWLQSIEGRPGYLSRGRGVVKRLESEPFHRSTGSDVLPVRRSRFGEAPPGSPEVDAPTPRRPGSSAPPWGGASARPRPAARARPVRGRGPSR